MLLVVRCLSVFVCCRCFTFVVCLLPVVICSLSFVVCRCCRALLLVVKVSLLVVCCCPFGCACCCLLLLADWCLFVVGCGLLCVIVDVCV